MSDQYLNLTGLSYFKDWILRKLNLKQNLVSNPTNGNVLTVNASGQAQDSGVSLSEKQDTLQSGTNIKTINGNSILGSGNVEILNSTFSANQVELEESDNNIYFVPATNGVDILAYGQNGEVTYFEKHLTDKTYVDTAIATELEAYEYQDYKFVEVLPDTGEAGYRYLLKIIDNPGPPEEFHMEEYMYIEGAWRDCGRFDSIKEATDTVAGTIKLNPTENITLNSNGQLTVGGRLGQTSELGLYAPVSAEPARVNRFSLLLSEAKGLSAAHREFIIAGGTNITLKSSAAPGATQYIVSNTQNNRFACAILIGGGSVLTTDEAYAKEKTVPIVSCKFANGNDVTAYYGATESNNNIIITTSESINPTSTISQIRIYGSWNNADVVSVGQGNRTGGGKILQIGGSLYAGPDNNQVLQVGNRHYSTQNNVIMVGNDLVSKKTFWALIGQGHDNSSGGSGGAAFGLWSNISANTKLAIGNGTAYNARSNIFEVRDNSGATELLLKSPNGTQYKVTVDNNGQLTTTPV